MKNIFFINLIVVASMMFTSCQSHKEEDGHAHEEIEMQEEHDEHENENTATLTTEQMQSIKIELGSIEKKQLTASIKANGLLRVPNDSKANVTALFGGIIKSIPVQVGNTVTKGQTIATIYNSTFIVMQEEFLNLGVELDLAELEYERQKTLKEGNANALKSFQQAEASLKLLKSKKSSLQKQLELIGINSATLTNENILSGISIKSPINGTISDIHVNIGSYTDANIIIAEIVDNSQLHLDLYVYEKDLQKIKVGQTIHFTLTNNPGKEYDADVYAISNTFEENSKAISVHAKVKGGKQGLIDGMSITALVSLEDANVDAVPTNAIVNHEGQDYVFIVTDEHAEEEHHEHSETIKDEHDEHGHSHAEQEEPEHSEEETTFEKIPIRKGTTDLGYSEITLLKDIPKDSKIVTNGAFFILAKMNNKGEGHAH
jgi:RND family efflux transporter MFP subunit